MVCGEVDGVACCFAEVSGVVDGFLQWEWAPLGRNQASLSHFDRLLLDKLVAFPHCLANARRELSQS